MTDRSTLYDVTVTTLVYGGEALGRLPDGRAVFVPFALPGETVRVRLVEEKRGHARAELVQILAGAPERISPRCNHFGICGGCHYQHIPYEAQLTAKREILRDQLERIAKLENPPVRPTVPSPNPYYYRNHVQFHLTQDGALGYHRWRSDEVFDAQECHLPEKPLNTVWPQLDFEALPEVERVGLRLGVDEDVQLILESSEIETPELSIEELPISVAHISPAGPLVLAGSAYVIIEVLGRPFRVSAGSFFQVNTPMAEAMVNHLLEYLPLTERTTAMDVYAGAGLFSAFIAPRAGRLIAIESAPAATEDFEANLDEFDNVELYEGTAEETLPFLNVHPDVVIVDPPRAGIDRKALDALVAMSPEMIAYVSCDPATLSRDGRRLIEAGYHLVQITPFDLFPQTYHIESISFWEKDPTKAKP